MKENLPAILMIVNFFPPRHSIASRRTGCLAKNLSRLGYKVTVVCESSGMREIIDDSIVTNLPKDVEVYEIISEHPAKLYKYYFEKCKLPGVLKFIFRLVLLGFIKPFNFYTNAKQLLKKLIKTQSFDLVLVSAPPYSYFSAYGLGCFLRKKAAIPLVIDFRDVPGELGSVEPFYMKCANLLYNVYRKYTIRHATAITTVTSGMANWLKIRNNVNAIVITNGFDSEDFRGENCRAKLLKFKIVFTGSMYVGSGSFTPLLDAIWNMNANGLLNLNNISVEFYGNIDKRVLGDSFLSHPCFSIVKIYPEVTWEQCKEKQNQAAILLQNSYPETSKKHNNLILPGKVLDYLSACRPILLLPSDNGIIAELLQQTNAGMAVSTDQELQNCLKSLYDEWKTSGTIGFKGNLDAIKLYSREAQAKQFANVFKKCLNSKI